jgi:hypothetical protein
MICARQRSAFCRAFPGSTGQRRVSSIRFADNLRGGGRWLGCRCARLSSLIELLLTLPSPHSELLQRVERDDYPIALNPASCEFVGIVLGRSSRVASRALRSSMKSLYWPCPRTLI